MAPQIEVISGVRSWRLELQADRSTVGKAAENDVPLGADATASQLHAVLERFQAGWCVSDLGSSNGTWVNGERTGPRADCDTATRSGSGRRGSCSATRWASPARPRRPGRRHPA